MTAACLLVRSPACYARQLQTSIVQVVAAFAPPGSARDLERGLSGINRRFTCRSEGAGEQQCSPATRPATGLEKSEKRGVQAARNGPSLPPTPAGGPVAKPELGTADRLGSRERGGRDNPLCGTNVSVYKIHFH